MGSCSAEAPSEPACLSVSLQQYPQVGGHWLGPRVPETWRRMEGLTSPSYADSAPGQQEGVHCSPLILNIAPVRSGTSDVYSRVMPHPSLVLAQQAAELDALDGAVNDHKEPKYWPYALGNNLSIEVYSKVYIDLESSVASDGIQNAERVRLRSLDFSAMNFDANRALIQAVLPEARFVAFLRNPIDRATSHCNFEFTKHVNTLKFADMYKVRSADLFHENALQVAEKFKGCSSEGHTAWECWQMSNRYGVAGCKNCRKTATSVLDSLYGAFLPWFQDFCPEDNFFARRLDDSDFGLDHNRASGDGSRPAEVHGARRRRVAGVTRQESTEESTLARQEFRCRLRPDAQHHPCIVAGVLGSIFRMISAGL
ncbi:unnamed protein product [Prorocentrum cordatum]|uniref:Sulfotransferase domain-containing protein n=1 Tax=Prorocentrum cordatum TaxID=2364126 RepID=A0ABN9YF46_9DINO|nr:unnamed protein product [Polarella glacialis]